MLPGVIDRDRNQTEFKRSLEDYLSIAASDERIAKGRAAFSRHRSTLNALEARYGVDADRLAVLVARQPRQLALGEPALAGDAVHDLDLLRVAGDGAQGSVRQL